MIRLLVRSAAEADIADAQAWYAERDGVLADRYFILPDEGCGVVIPILRQSRAARVWRKRAKVEG
jgi:hypothetical protein